MLWRGFFVLVKFGKFLVGTRIYPGLEGVSCFYMEDFGFGVLRPGCGRKTMFFPGFNKDSGFLFVCAVLPTFCPILPSGG